MKKCCLIIPVLALLTGCATKQMKSTPFYSGSDVTYVGKPEDRVNLWPLAYWREPVGSILWPMVSFSDDHFAFRPIYSQYKQDGKDGKFDEFNFLWPICQLDYKNYDYHFFPFSWGKDEYGDKHHSLFPLWYWNDDGNTFLSPLYCQLNRGWCIPPLLSWGGTNADGNTSHYYLLGFSGWESKDRDLTSSYLFPLYGWVRGHKFITPLFSRFVDKDGTDYKFALALAGFSTGQDRNEWLFPIWFHDRDKFFPEATKILDEKQMPKNFDNLTEIRTNYAFVSTNDTEESIVAVPERTTRFRKQNNSNLLLLLCVWYDSVYGDFANNDTNRYQITRSTTRGNLFLSFYKSKRTVEFDTTTRLKTSDQEEDNFGVLLDIPYCYKRETDRIAGQYYSRHRILFWLWDREEKDGDVSLDAFPGFTYDSKANGYVKTSFLWRFFRYERDPEKGVSADFLFIPIWRP